MGRRVQSFRPRDEEVAEKQGVSEDEDDGVNRPLTVYTYDNLGEVTETQVYDGDGVSPTISSGELRTCNFLTSPFGLFWHGVFPLTWADCRKQIPRFSAGCRDVDRLFSGGGSRHASRF